MFSDWHQSLEHCLLLFVLLPVSTVSQECGRPLLWNKKLNMGYGQGLQLQVCCSVRAVTIHKMDSTKEWTIDGQPVRRQLTADGVDDFWSELQLSVCNDTDEATLGFVQGRGDLHCSYPQGKVINVSPDLFEMNRWYVICYQTADDCSHCHFDILCDNEYSFACAKVWMQSSVSAVANDSMTLWVKVGEQLPFAKSSNITVTVVDQQNGQTIATYSKSPKLNTTLMVDVENLRSNNFYLVRTCLHIVPPKYFQDTYQLPMQTPKPMCQENAYRTFAASAGQGSRSLLTIFNHPCSYLHFVFVIAYVLILVID